MARRHLVFDLDGTLIDSREDLAAALNAALEAEGWPPHSVDAITHMVGHGASELVRRALPDGSPDQRTAVRARFFDKYRASLTARTRLYPGLAAALDELLASGYPMSIATNKPRIFTEALVKALDLSRWFASFACGDEGERKPDPEVVRLAVTRAGEIFQAERVVYIGDMLVDLETAENAGCRFVGVQWGFGAEALVCDPRVNDLARRPEELPGIFERSGTY